MCGIDYFQTNTDLLQRIRQEVPCNIVGGCNLRTSIRVLRNLLSSAELLPANKMDTIATKFIAVLSPMIKAIQPNVLFYCTPKQKEDLDALDKRITLTILNDETASDDEVFEKFEDFKQSIAEEENLDDILKDLNNGIVQSENQKKQYVKKMESSFTDLNENGIDIGSLLKQNNVKVKEEEVEDSPFSVLSTLKLKEKEASVTEIITLPDTDINTWTSEQKLQLLKKTEKLVQEKIVLQDNDFMDEQVSIFDKFKKEDYDFSFSKKDHYKIMDLPIYAMTRPFLTKSALDSLGVKGEQVLSGWVLENQKCVGVRNRYDLEDEIAFACNELRKKTGVTWFNASYLSEWVTKGINGITWAWLVPTTWNLYFGNLCAIECQHAFKYFNRNGNLTDLKRRRLEVEEKIKQATAPYYDKQEKYQIRLNKWLNKLDSLPDLSTYPQRIDALKYKYSNATSIKDKLSLNNEIESLEKEYRKGKKRENKYSEKCTKYRSKWKWAGKKIKELDRDIREESLQEYRRLMGA